MGDDPQVDQPGQVGVVGEVLGEPAIVEPRELLEHQAGQELVLGELLGAELVPVRGEGLTGGVVGDLEDPARGFAGGHISYTSRDGRRFTGFLQSISASNQNCENFGGLPTEHKVCQKWPSMTNWVLSPRPIEIQNCNN